MTATVLLPPPDKRAGSRDFEASRKQTMNAIEVDHLTKKFGDLVAVNDISFNVAQQEIFGLLGPNGAGKTTLIRMMTTLTPPTSGTARIAGHDIREDANGVRHAMGVIPQALTSDPELTAVENMVSPREALRRASPATRAKLSTIYWNRLICSSSKMRWYAHFRAACGGGWKSRVAWFIRRRFYFLTSRQQVWIRFREPTCGK